MGKHLFVSDVDGCLYRTDVPAWAKQSPIRANYSWPHTEIESAADLKASLRYGEYAWPGGYQLFFVTHDCQPLSFDTVRKHLRQVLWAIKNRDNTGGWRVVGCEVIYGDEAVFDSHTNHLIGGESDAA